MTISSSSAITGYLGYIKDFPFIYIWLFILITILIILMIKNQLYEKNKKFKGASFKFKLSPSATGGINRTKISSSNIGIYKFPDYNSNYDGKGNKKLIIVLETKQKMIDVEYTIKAVDVESSKVSFIKPCINGNYCLILQIVGFEIDNRVYEITITNNE